MWRKDSQNPSKSSPLSKFKRDFRSHLRYRIVTPVTRSGAVFAWGSNSHGQLGLGDTTDRVWPVQVTTLRSLRVLPGGVRAGLEHTLALTEEGGVFSWGSGRCGQLGHGSTGNETQPRKIMELMGTVVSQIAAGDRHSLALVPSRGKLYAFGVGGRILKIGI